jgi:hypothetical protein
MLVRQQQAKASSPDEEVRGGDCVWCRYFYTSTNTITTWVVIVVVVGLPIGTPWLHIVLSFLFFSHLPDKIFQSNQYSLKYPPGVIFLSSPNHHRRHSLKVRWIILDFVSFPQKHRAQNQSAVLAGLPFACQVGRTWLERLFCLFAL